MQIHFPTIIHDGIKPKQTLDTFHFPFIVFLLHFQIVNGNRIIGTGGIVIAQKANTDKSIAQEISGTEETTNKPLSNDNITLPFLPAI